MRVGSLYTMRRVNIGSFMNQVNESILLNQELNKSPFLRAIEADSIPELSAMIETETIDELDFETQIKIAEHQERIEQENMEQEMDFIIEQQEMKKRNHSFRTWLFNHKINSADHYIKDFKATTDSSCFRYISKSGLYIDSDLLPMLHADGWINKDISDLTFNDFINLYEANPVHENYL